MSLLSWFSRRARAAAAGSPEDSGISRTDATLPFRDNGAAGSPQARPVDLGSRRTDRVEHREQLYSVIRESMVRSGVLSSSYKFKVLAVDPRGRQFLVMMDLAREYGKDPARLSEIEAMVAQAAKSRFGILVSALYWRQNDYVSVGQPQVRTTGVSSAPAPLVAQPPAPVAAVPSPRPAAPRFEPIEAEEVEAFRRALATAVTTARADAAARLDAETATKLVKPSARMPDEGLLVPRPSRTPWGTRQPATKTKPTGYEDTEAFDPREPVRNPGLSPTQYGDLH